MHVHTLDGVVKFTATDGAQTLILETSKIRITREGRALLPAKKFQSIFDLAPESATTLTVLAETATVSSGRAIWNIAVPVADRSPAVPDIDDIKLHEISRRDFYKAVNAVKRALPSLGNRKSLEQANVRAGAITASDGYRLIRQKIENFPRRCSSRSRGTRSMNSFAR